jgi:hypothetical protein
MLAHDALPTIGTPINHRVHGRGVRLRLYGGIERRSIALEVIQFTQCSDARLPVPGVFFLGTHAASRSATRALSHSTTSA